MGLISEGDKEYLREEFERNLKRNVVLLYFDKRIIERTCGFK
jgi:hypothetical protein